MSDVSTKSTAKEAAPSMSYREQKMRDVQQKRFPPSALKALGYGDSEMLTLTVPSDITFEEVLNPITWSSVSSIVARDALKTRNIRDGAGCIIYLDTEDSSYCAWLRVSGVVRDKMNNPCGINVICIGPSLDMKTGEARPINLKTGRAWVDPVKSTKKD